MIKDFIGYLPQQFYIIIPIFKITLLFTAIYLSLRLIGVDSK